MKSTAIVGFGFCGRLAFLHLVKKSTKNKILIFDPNLPNTLGPAFSPFSPHYILNVPAIKMSAFSNAPRDFCEFLEKKYPQVWREVGENGYAPRYIYGEYLDELTKQAFLEAKKNNVVFELVAEGVSEILPQEEGFLINQKFAADEVFLATSFKQSELPANIDVTANLVTKNLWSADSKQFHQENFTNQTICLIGSGLTAVDVIVGLKKKNFAGKIFVISRRGNFPKKHFGEIQSNLNFISASDAKNGVLFLCLKIRNFLKQNPQFDLRHAIDSIRQITTELWQNFDKKNKKQFLRLLPYWNIFRHRAPIASIETIEQMIENGQIEILKKGRKNLECDLLVNCLGFEFKAEKYPLFAQMLAANLLKKDLLLTQSNHPKIHLLGGLNIGRDFECTAVPDLRVSVEKSV
ncbi:MAG: FAD/NAD(P)-binding protein [Rickettsiales bacterium]|nr:FAD/NAD(P)-binding protein [Rickettsiales bacterium]